MRCGNGLELPHDVRLFHIDCPFCGQDNLLPPELVQSRQRQYELEQRRYALELEEQQRKRAAEEKANAQKRSNQRLLIWLSVGAFVFFGLFGSFMTIGYFASKAEEEEKARAKDPELNGQAALLRRFDVLRQQQCERILVQPRTHRAEPASLALNMVKNDHCVHVLAMTGASTRLSMSYSGQVALTTPLPPSGRALDYRLCAAETTTYSFGVDAAPAEPFSVAAIECPRTPAEGGPRSGPDDAKRTGKERLMSAMAELVQAGCKHVVAEPRVSRGEQTFTLTSPDNAPCYNLLAASYFSDVKLAASLKDENGKNLPVPAPDSKIRVAYCAPKAGKYTLMLSPSSGDYYAHTSVDCPRFGPEGLKRLKTLYP